MGNALFASCLPDAQADSQALREAALNVPPPSSSATPSSTSSHGFSSSADLEDTNSGAGVFASTPTNNTTSSFSPSSPPSSSTILPGPSGINVRRAPEAAPAPRRSTPPAGHERAEAAAPAPGLGGAVKPAAKPQPQPQPPKKVEEEVDYFQDMEPTYVRPTIIQKGPAKPQAASRLAVETDPSWEEEAEGAWDEDGGLE